MKSLGYRIKKLRDAENLSQARLAKALGISNVQLSRYETGDRKPDPDMIKSIADFFNVSTDYLLGRTDDKEGSLSVAFSHGGNLTADEEAHLEEELKRYRQIKERFMAEKRKDEDSKK